MRPPRPGDDAAPSHGSGGVKKKIPKRKLRVGQYVKRSCDERIHMVKAIDHALALVLISIPEFEDSERWVRPAELTILVEHAPA